MKLMITEFKNDGGAHYTVIKTEDNAPVGQIGSIKIIEVVDTVGNRLLKEHAELLRHQMELQEIMYSGVDSGNPFSEKKNGSPA